MGVLEFVKQEGIEEGIVIGFEKGLEKGLENLKRDFVRKLLQEPNMPVEKIAYLTGVTVEFVNESKAGLSAQS